MTTDSQNFQSLMGNPVLLMDLKEFANKHHMSVRLRNCLLAEFSGFSEERYTPIAYILTASVAQLKKVPTLGRVSIQELDDILKAEGLSIGATADFKEQMGVTYPFDDNKSFRFHDSNLFKDKTRTFFQIPATEPNNTSTQDAEIPSQPNTANDTDIQITLTDKGLSITFGDSVSSERRDSVERKVLAALGSEFRPADLEP